MDDFIEQANKFHPTGKFTAEISEKEITFLDTNVYKRQRFYKEALLEVRTHYKPTETFHYTNFYSCPPPGVTKGFIKGEALRRLRTNSSKTTFEANIKDFMSHLISRGYPVSPVKKHLGEVQFSDRHSALTQKNQTARKRILPFVTQ